MSDNPTLTTAQKQAFSSLFASVKRESTMGSDVAQEVLSKLFQQVIGEDVANIGFDMVNGDANTLESLRTLLERYGDDFIPNLNIEWDDISIETLMAKAELEARWSFNIPSVARKVEGVSGGQLIEVGARPNTGKTSFHASIIAGPNGFAHQGANCIILCNEEPTHRVGARYLTAAAGMSAREVRDNMSKAQLLYSPVMQNIKIKDAGGRDMAWVESVCKSYKPDVLVLDMGDKFGVEGSYAREDQALAACAIYARQIAKTYDCAVFYMSQLSADAEGRAQLNQSMMQGSRTGKAAEADLMILIGKSPSVEGQEEDSPLRHINIVKNKLNGWHGMVNCELNYQTARYEG
jgi:replicative DNA helicase